MGWYTGKKVFVVGGSKGIGRSIALQLAKDGAHVMIAARGQEALDETVAALKAAGSDSQTLASVSVDVTDIQAVHASAEKVLETLGGLDVLICNSGYSRPGYTHDVPEDVFRAMIDVNYLGHVYMTRAFLPHFMKQGNGDICLVSSMMGFLPLYGYSAYSASKFAIVGFAEALRQEMVPHGVRVGVFYPPTTETPGLEIENQTKPRDVWLLESDSAFSSTYSADAVAQAVLRFIPKGRFDSVVGAMNWFIYLFSRHFPGISRILTDQEVAGARKKVAAEGASPT